MPKVETHINNFIVVKAECHLHRGTNSALSDHVSIVYEFRYYRETKIGRFVLISPYRVARCQILRPPKKLVDI